MTLEECFRICRTAVSDDEVEEALVVLRDFINLALKHSIQYSDFSTLGTLVRQLAIHKDDMDARIPLEGLQWTSKYCEKIEGWEQALLAIEKHKENKIMPNQAESSYEYFTPLSQWMEDTLQL